MLNNPEKPTQGRFDIVDEVVPTFQASDPAREALIQLFVPHLKSVQPEESSDQRPLTWNVYNLAEGRITHQIAAVQARRGIRGFFGIASRVLKVISLDK